MLEKYQNMSSIPDGCQRRYLYWNKLWNCRSTNAGIFQRLKTAAAAAQRRLLQSNSVTITIASVLLMAETICPALMQ